MGSNYCNWVLVKYQCSPPPGLGGDSKAIRSQIQLIAGEKFAIKVGPIGSFWQSDCAKLAVGNSKKPEGTGPKGKNKKLCKRSRKLIGRVP